MPLLETHVCRDVLVSSRQTAATNDSAMHYPSNEGLLRTTTASATRLHRYPNCCLRRNKASDNVGIYFLQHYTMTSQRSRVDTMTHRERRSIATVAAIVVLDPGELALSTSLSQNIRSTFTYTISTNKRL